MKKRIKFNIISLICLIAFPLIFFAISKILHIFQLEIRIWLWWVVYFITFVLGLAFLCGLIYSLQLLKKDWFWFLRVAGTLALIILLIYSSLFSVFLIEWCLDTEYIVERNGQKMIAEEQYWLDPAVDYYEYKNCIVRGKYIEFSSVPTIKDEKNIIVK